MIKLSQEIPEIFDVSNPDALRQWMIAVKQCIDELARKAQSLQEELRTSAPNTNDLTEAEMVRRSDLYYIYTKINGTLRYISTNAV